MNWMTDEQAQRIIDFCEQARLVPIPVSTETTFGGLDKYIKVAVDPINADPTLIQFHEPRKSEPNEDDE